MSIPSNQKALLLHKESTPYVLEERPVPRPGPHDVLVKLMAVALNPFDWSVAVPPYSTRFISSYPYIAGVDGAGVVVDVGAEVNNLKKGDKILFQAANEPDGAAFQQYAIVHSNFTSIIPDNITFEQAATLPLAFSTVFLGLYNLSPAPENLSIGLKPVWDAEGATAFAGKPALIVGGATSLGQFAIQLARLAGHSPIITTASPHNASFLTSIGATHVLDRARSTESIIAELPTLTGGKPIEFVLTAVATEDVYRLAVAALAPGGLLQTVMPAPDYVPKEVANAGEGRRVGYVFGSVFMPSHREVSLGMFKHITGWLESGQIKPNRVEVLPGGLAGVSAGLERIKGKKVSGTKLVVRPPETP
ncbi:GroES-like protein [Trametes maxima]|nr:GroES-like protein [Trametes maxima]